MITNKRFVKTWMGAVSDKKGLGSVATKLGLSKGGVSVRANILRRKGVNLPHMPLPTPELSVTELNDLIKELEK